MSVRKGKNPKTEETEDCLLVSPKEGLLATQYALAGGVSEQWVARGWLSPTQSFRQKVSGQGRTALQSTRPMLHCTGLWSLVAAIFIKDALSRGWVEGFWLWKMDLEGRLATHLPAGDFIRWRVLLSNLCPALHGCFANLGLLAWGKALTSKRRKPLLTTPLQISENTLPWEAKKNAVNRAFCGLSGAQASSEACQFSFPGQLARLPAGRKTFLESNNPEEWLNKEWQKALVIFYRTSVFLPV